MPTRMEFYLQKEKDWKQLSNGVWLRGGKTELGRTRINSPRAYIASSLTGLKDNEAASFKKHLEGLGDVLEEHGIASVIPHRDTMPETHYGVKASIVYNIDNLKAAHSGFVVADGSHASTGAGMELEIGGGLAPIILLMKKDTKISRMPLGHPSVIASIEYENAADARVKLGKILRLLLGKPSPLRKKIALAQRAEDKQLFKV